MAFATLREWQEQEQLVRCDLSFRGVTILLHGRFIGVEDDLIGFCSPDTASELSLIPSSVLRWGSYLNTYRDGSERDAIVAYLPDDDTITFSVPHVHTIRS